MLTRGAIIRRLQTGDRRRRNELRTLPLLHDYHTVTILSFYVSTSCASRQVARITGQPLAWGVTGTAGRWCTKLRDTSTLPVATIGATLAHPLASFAGTGQSRTSCIPITNFNAIT